MHWLIVSEEDSLVNNKHVRPVKVVKMIESRWEISLKGRQMEWINGIDSSEKTEKFISVELIFYQKCLNHF